MKKDIIIRNLERLIYSSPNGDQEAIEPMSEWKWNKMYQIACDYHIGPWLADGIRNYEGAFFLNLSSDTRQKMLALAGEKDQLFLNKFQLSIDRKQSLRKRLSSQSVRAYAEDFLKVVRNIEE